MEIAIKLLVYNVFVRGFIPYVTTDDNKVRYGISATQASALTAFLTLWTSKYDVNVAPLTHTPGTESDLIDAYQTGFPLTNSIRGKIKLDTTITLSALERQVLDLPKPNPRRHHVDVPNYGPSFVCTGLIPLKATMAAINPDNVFKRAKPPGVDLIGVEMVITEFNAPVPKDEDYIRQSDENGTTFDVLFTNAQSGKRAYIRGFYINARGEESPRGIPCVFTIA